jgi:hypothetical protein
MPSANFEQQIRNSIEAFVEELSALVRHAAIQSVNEAFGGASQSGAARRGPAARAGRKKGEKRDPADLAKLEAQLLSAVKGTPGQRIEQIAKALKTTTRELALPAKKLIAGGKLKTKGDRRATKYFPG